MQKNRKEEGREGGRKGGRGGKTYLVDVARVEADGVVALGLDVLQGEVVVGHLGGRKGGREGGREGEQKEVSKSQNSRCASSVPPSLPPSLPPYLWRAGHLTRSLQAQDKKVENEAVVLHEERGELQATEGGGEREGGREVEKGEMGGVRKYGWGEKIEHMGVVLTGSTSWAQC